MNVFEAIQIRRSVRSYSSKAIPEPVLERMRTVLRAAPSACNFQPWHFVFVSDSSLRQTIARASFNQGWIAEAPLIVVGCSYPDQAYKRMGGSRNSAEIDVAIALDHLTLAAVAEGLGTCWVGAFDEQAVKRHLNIPDLVEVVALTPLGYPTTPDLIRTLDSAHRKPPAEIFSYDRFTQP